MATIGLIGTLVFFLGFIASVLMIFSKKRRSKVLASTLVCVVGFVVSFFIFGIFGDRAARNLGWEDMSEQTAAKKHGIEDPSIWKESRDQLLAQQAAEEVVEAETQEADEGDDENTEVVEDVQEPEELAETLAPIETAAAIPQDQENLRIIVENGRSAYLSARNDMQKGASKPTRARELCSHLSMNVNDWRGVVTTL